VYMCTRTHTYTHIRARARSHTHVCMYYVYLRVYMHMQRVKHICIMALRRWFRQSLLAKKKEGTLDDVEERVLEVVLHTQADIQREREREMQDVDAGCL